VVQVASEKQAADIVLLDVGGVASFTDYFVILSAENSRQMNAVSEDILHVLKKEGLMPRHTEGSADSGWLLIDYGYVIVHIFTPLQRAHYQLDALWNEAKPVVRIQ
jgi:ribosome-associated protein